MNEIYYNRINVWVPPHCTQHQCVKGRAVGEADNKRRCVFCKNYTLNISTNTCTECLSTKNLDSFVVDKWVGKQSWYKHFDKDL